jgi:hypothetical protein
LEPAACIDPGKPRTNTDSDGTVYAQAEGQIRQMLKWDPRHEADHVPSSSAATMADSSAISRSNIPRAEEAAAFLETGHLRDSYPFGRIGRSERWSAGA